MPLTCIESSAISHGFIVDVSQITEPIVDHNLKKLSLPILSEHIFKEVRDEVPNVPGWRTTDSANNSPKNPGFVGQTYTFVEGPR